MKLVGLSLAFALSFVSSMGQSQVNFSQYNYFTCQSEDAKTQIVYSTTNKKGYPVLSITIIPEATSGVALKPKEIKSIPQLRGTDILVEDTKAFGKVVTIGSNTEAVPDWKSVSYSFIVPEIFSFGDAVFDSLLLRTENYSSIMGVPDGASSSTEVSSAKLKCEASQLTF